MSLPQGTIPLGATISWATDGTSLSYTPFAQVLNIQFPNPKMGTAKATQLNQGHRYHLYIPTMIDGGQVNFDQIYSDTNFTAINALGITNCPNGFWCKIVLPDSSNVAFPAILEDIKFSPLDLDKDEVWKMTITLKVAGVITTNVV